MPSVLTSSRVSVESERIIVKHLKFPSLRKRFYDNVSAQSQNGCENAVVLVHHPSEVVFIFFIDCYVDFSAFRRFDDAQQKTILTLLLLVPAGCVGTVTDCLMSCIL